MGRRRRRGVQCRRHEFDQLLRHAERHHVQRVVRSELVRLLPVRTSSVLLLRGVLTHRSERLRGADLG